MQKADISRLGGRPELGYMETGYMQPCQSDDALAFLLLLLLTAQGPLREASARAALASRSWRREEGSACPFHLAPRAPPPPTASPVFAVLL